jgi:hypothetical protein
VGDARATRKVASAPLANHVRDVSHTERSFAYTPVMTAQRVVALLAASVLMDCANDSDCAGSACPPDLNLVASCVAAGSCTVNGQTSACAGEQCPLFVLPPNTVVGLPLDWSFASRNDVDLSAPERPHRAKLSGDGGTDASFELPVTTNRSARSST